MAIRIVTTRSGYQHALAPADQQTGQHNIRTVCHKSVSGPLDSVTSVEDIRCRPCKGLLYKGRPFQQTKG